ncbi:hypothetical protein ABIA38_001971 [Embleya sp. AB8]
MKTAHAAHTDRVEPGRRTVHRTRVAPTPTTSTRITTETAKPMHTDHVEHGERVRYAGPPVAVAGDSAGQSAGRARAAGHSADPAASDGVR